MEEFDKWKATQLSDNNDRMSFVLDPIKMEICSRNPEAIC